MVGSLCWAPPLFAFSTHAHSQSFCGPSPKPRVTMVTILTSCHLRRIFFPKGPCALFIRFIYCVPSPSCVPQLCASHTSVPIPILAPSCCLYKGPTPVPVKTKDTGQKPGADGVQGPPAWEGGEGGAVEEPRAGCGLVGVTPERSRWGDPLECHQHPLQLTEEAGWLAPPPRVTVASGGSAVRTAFGDS